MRSIGEVIRCGIVASEGRLRIEVDRAAELADMRRTDIMRIEVDRVSQLTGLTGAAGGREYERLRSLAIMRRIGRMLRSRLKQNSPGS